MSSSPGSLRRVIAVGRGVEIPTGGTLFVTAVEVWDGALVVHAAEQLPEVLPPGKPIDPIRPLWMITDDVGTAYVPGGATASGSQSHRTSTYISYETVPPSATTLFIVGPGMREDAPIEVDLT